MGITFLNIRAYAQIKNDDFPFTNRRKTPSPNRTGRHVSTPNSNLRTNPRRKTILSRAKCSFPPPRTSVDLWPKSDRLVGRKRRNAEGGGYKRKGIEEKTKVFG